MQRGNNRDACFFAEEDFQFYKEVLAEGLKRYGAQLHAYCLMTNHVHLLITPHFTDSISRILQRMLYQQNLQAFRHFMGRSS